jgi:CRP/FNR family transcriptional regulator
MQSENFIKEISKFNSQYYERKYKAGSTILYQGEAPRTACIVVEGVVKVYAISRTGEEQIVALHVKNEPFPTSWLFETSPTTLFFYEAMTTCTIGHLPKTILIDFYFSSSARTKLLLNYFARNYSASLIRTNALQQSRARDKLLYTLYYLAIRYAQQKSDIVNLPILLTHQSLANLVGITRETTASELSKLKKQNILKYKNQRYIINTKQLLLQLGEDNFDGLNIKP